MVTPKKYLGQHFLNNPAICDQIVQAIPKHPQALVEIGPGTGAITKLIMDKGNRSFKVVEHDKEAVEFLARELEGLEIIQGDILKEDWDFYENEKYGLVGNLPYNISSPIFFKLLEYREMVDFGVFMTQKEVATRIMSGPGTKENGILSVLIQAFYFIEKVLDVSPSNFTPPPKVMSTVFRLRRNTRKVENDYFKSFKKVVKLAYSQRRKMLRNTLSPLGNVNDFVPEEFLTKRAEQLSVDDFLCITSNFQKERS